MGNFVDTTRSRALDRQAHYLRHLVHAGVINYTYIPGPSNRADAFTKSVPAPAFELARTRWNVRGPDATAPKPRACAACYTAKAFKDFKPKASMVARAA